MSGLLSGGNRVNIDIRATNNASSVIGQVSSDLGGLSSQAGMFGGGGGGLGDLLGSGLGAGAMIGGAAYLGGMAYDLGEMGANIEAVRFSYERLASQIGIDSADLLTALQDASGGTIAEYDLMLAANRAMRFGVADNIGELVSIMQYAKGSAREFGSDTTSAFDDLVTGIGRNSALILDNVGITLPQINEAYAAYAETIGKTVEDLTDLEKKQGLVNAVMAAGETFDLTGTWSLDQYEANAAAMEDLRGEAGKLINTLTGPLAGWMAGGLGRVNQSVQGEADFGSLGVNSGAATREAIQESIDYLNRSSLELENNLQSVDAALRAAEGDYGVNLSLLQSGVDDPAVMAGYLDAMERMNELTREKSAIERSLAGLPPTQWTKGITPSEVAATREANSAVIDLAETLRGLDTAQGTYGDWIAQQQAASAEAVDVLGRTLSNTAGLQNFGESAGAAWGSGFLSGAMGSVGGIVESIAAAVAPIVERRLMQNRSRSSAS